MYLNLKNYGWIQAQLGTFFVAGESLEKVKEKQISCWTGKLAVLQLDCALK